MGKKYRLHKDSRRVFLEGLKKFLDAGIPILIDGEPSGPSQWNRLVEIHPDGTFYMMDLVFEDCGIGTGEIMTGLVCEETGGYRLPPAESMNNERIRRLKEIRFDRVYNH